MRASSAQHAYLEGTGSQPALLPCSPVDKPFACGDLTEDASVALRELGIDDDLEGKKDAWNLPRLTRLHQGGGRTGESDGALLHEAPAAESRDLLQPHRQSHHRPRRQRRQVQDQGAQVRRPVPPFQLAALTTETSLPSPSVV